MSHEQRRRVPSEAEIYIKGKREKEQVREMFSRMVIH